MAATSSQFCFYSGLSDNSLTLVNKNITYLGTLNRCYGVQTARALALGQVVTLTFNAAANCNLYCQLTTPANGQVVVYDLATSTPLFPTVYNNGIMSFIASLMKDKTYLITYETLVGGVAIGANLFDFGCSTTFNVTDYFANGFTNFNNSPLPSNVVKTTASSGTVTLTFTNFQVTAGLFYSFQVAQSALIPGTYTATSSNPSFLNNISGAFNAGESLLFSHVGVSTGTFTGTIIYTLGGIGVETGRNILFANYDAGSISGNRALTSAYALRKRSFPISIPIPDKATVIMESQHEETVENTQQIDEEVTLIIKQV